MKRIITAITCLVLLSASNIFSQELIGNINPALTEKPWLDKEIKIIDGYSIKMIFGENLTKYRHLNYGPITSIAYHSLDWILKELDSLATADNWTDEKKNNEIKKYKEQAVGGVVDVFIARYEESRANFRWFFIILRNEKDKKINEIQLGYQAPELPQGTGWWNFKRVPVDIDLSLPFFVYLNDKQSTHLSDFKFKISKAP